MKKSSSVNQLGHILHDHTEGKFSKDDLIEHIHNFIKLIPLDKKGDVIGSMKMSLEEIYHTLHQEMVELMIESTNITESESKKDEDEIMSIKDVLKYCQITKPTFYEWKKKGLKTIKQGGRVYILKSELSKYLIS